MRMPDLLTLSPLLNDLRQYKAEWLPPDLIAGLSVAAVQVPTAMAYATLAGFSPEIGLYSSILPVIVYAFFGTSKQLVVGPDAATSAMVASLVAPLAAGDPTKYVAFSAALSLVAGLLMIAGGVMRMGFFVNFFARPILVGFLNGIAISIVAGQMGKFLGIAIHKHDFIPSILELVSRLRETHLLTVGIGVSTVLMLAALRRLAPKAPASLIALLVASCGLFYLGGAHSGVTLVGSIPAGLPQLGLPYVDYHAGQGILVGALGLVIVSFTSGMLTARSFAARAGQTIDPNHEMWAIGAANLAAGLSGSFAVTGADSRTAVNASSGNKTQLSSVFAAVATAVVAACLSGPLGFLPVSALSAVLIFSAFQLVDLESGRELHRIDPFEFKLSVFTTVAVLLLGVLPGVAISILVALVILLKRIYQPYDTVLGSVPGREGYNDIALSPESTTIPGIIIWRFDGPLVFFNADYFKTRVRQVIDQAAEKPRWLVFSLEAVSQADATGIKAFEEMTAEVRARGICLLLARPKSYMRRLREFTGIMPEDIFTTIHAAVDAAIFRDAARASQEPQT